MNILLIRHGQSEADLLQVIEGRADFNLTDLGHTQASQAARWLRDKEAIDFIYASPLRRARQTADYIGSQVDLPISFDDRLMEWDNGQLAGLSHAEADRRFPLGPQGRLPHHTQAGTESFLSFRSRAEHFVSELKEKHQAEDKICIVAHGGSITMLLRALLNLPTQPSFAFALADTSIHKVIDVESTPRLFYMNSTEHTRCQEHKRLDLVDMIIEQTPQHKKRMVYQPEDHTFTESAYDCLHHSRGVTCHYGWIVGTGRPPGDHLDIFLFGAWDHELGDQVQVKVLGIFIRSDGDHKVIACPPKSPYYSLEDLPDHDLDQVYKLYPQVGPGEAWLGRLEALTWIETYKSKT